MSNWDGFWYLQTAAHWYGHVINKYAGQYQTLGFMPLYPMLIWLVAHVTQIGNLGAGHRALADHGRDRDGAGRPARRGVVG